VAKAKKPVRARRSRTRLKLAIEQARSARSRALAHYELGLFHDNNSREAAAIPHYLKAIRLGLPRSIKAQALAWLASSLYKTGSPDKALGYLRKASALASDGRLRQFLARLERRIRAAIQ